MLEPAPASPTTRPEPQDATGSDTDPESALLAALREATGVPTLDFDEDRDVGLRFGELPVLVRLVDGPPRVRIHSVVLDDVEPDAELLARLNELNAQAGGIRWIAGGRRVVAVVEIPAAPVVAAHVAQALHGFCGTCEGLAKLLRAEFGDGASALARGASRVLH